MTQKLNRVLPSNVESYAQTPIFTAKSIPQALLEKHKMATGTHKYREVPEKLLNDHDIKAGTWGRLTVINGSVDYFLEGQTVPLTTVLPESPLVILPEESHFINISDDAIFFVEFFH